ncbi:MAG: 50S ribosomal protein L23 [Clostridia bacterium]|nr:50S ribosomal protein L23 [Clostridia bacterium]MBR2327276.1 50S ribosomal protein L23 [Clostridia bacterium]
MMEARDIIIRPIITEKSMGIIADKKYTFEVAKAADKTMIKKAVEEIFEVKVKKVNTINKRGKNKRQGMSMGRTKSWKKAVVTLTADSKTIAFFDSLM